MYFFYLILYNYYMKKIINKWTLLIIIIFVIILVIFIKNKDEELNYIIELSKVTNLLETVEVTGSIESADDIQLNFPITGTLSNIFITVGDIVNNNKVLATLLSRDKEALVESAKAQVDIAQSELDALLAGASSEDIQVTEEEVFTSEKSYQVYLDNLENLKNTQNIELSNLKESSVNILHNKYFTVQYSLDLIYDIILDPIAKNFLTVSDISKLIEAKNKYETSKESYENVSSIINTATTSNEYNNIILALEEFEKVLEEVSNALSLTFNVLVTIINNNEYTETVVNNFKLDINTQVTSINNAISLVQTEFYNLSMRNLYYINEIITANNNIELALANLNLAKAKLNLKKTPARNFEISSSEANLRNAQANLERYLSDLSQTVIKSPVNGIITEVNFDKGEQTSLSKPVISMISLSKMQIEVDVPESDITKLEIEDKVNITLDAFSSDKIFEGTITFIDPAATVINEVIYYKVRVNFDELDDKIKSGMTADLIILTNSKENVLAIPSRSIIYREEEKYVNILENGNLLDKLIVTGLKGDDGLIEIISGIKEGDEIVTFIDNKD